VNWIRRLLNPGDDDDGDSAVGVFIRDIDEMVTNSGGKLEWEPAERGYRIANSHGQFMWLYPVEDDCLAVTIPPLGGLEFVLTVPDFREELALIVRGFVGGPVEFVITWNDPSGEVLARFSKTANGATHVVGRLWPSG
jgi:hypothetical protein